jgi:PAS domain-containing protein
MPLNGVNASSALSRRKRAELWVSGSRNAQDVPDGHTKAEALAKLFRYAGIPERGGEALKLLHEILVDQVAMLLQLREQDEARLAAARVFNQFVDMYDLAPIAYFSVDPAGRVVTANMAAAVLFERPIGQLVGKTLFDLLGQSSGNTLWRWARTLSETTPSESLDFEFRRNNRHARHLHAVARKLEASETTVLMLVDITHVIAGSAADTEV